MVRAGRVVEDGWWRDMGVLNSELREIVSVKVFCGLDIELAGGEEVWIVERICMDSSERGRVLDIGITSWYRVLLHTAAQNPHQAYPQNIPGISPEYPAKSTKSTYVVASSRHSSPDPSTTAHPISISPYSPTCALQSPLPHHPRPGHHHVCPSLSSAYAS